MGNMHNKLEQDRPIHGQSIDVNANNRNISNIWSFFRPLLNLSNNCFLVACIPH